MKYGLIGEHLPHSFSKVIHEAIGGYEYQLKELAPAELDAFLKAKDFTGINVTIPYKQAVIPYLNSISETAKAIGAVNTIVNVDGKLWGHNTDFGGMKALMEKEGIDPDGKKVLIFGTGGTSKTASAAAKAMGASQVLRASRSGKEGALTYEQAYELCGDVEIIINTTPCGMFPKAGEVPADLSRFPRLSGLVDAIYNPLNTELVLQAKKRGIPASGGLYMLVAQAVLASEAFLDPSPETLHRIGTAGAKISTAVLELTDRIYGKLLAEKQNIVLIGMPGSGKTTVGKLLAEHTGRPLLDSDEEIVKRHGSITAIFARYGEQTFRDFESEVIAELSARNGIILSTGGGAILRPENVDALSRNGVLYYLDRPLEQLLPTEDRPLASSREAIEARYRERSHLYRAAAHQIIPNGSSAEDAAAEIERRHTK
ncbi:MAG: shikimate dehydrogenase [Clostridiales bacterium]|nr:shikimate dehydrogenase [Clostridiales bacterium]